MAEPVAAEVMIQELENHSSGWSIGSRRSVQSLLSGSWTYSSGQRSLEGATWRQDLVLTMNSGFGAGSRRMGNNKEVREGRERGGFLPRIGGVGRLGRGPVRIPPAMLRALGVKSAGSGLEVVDETEDEEMYRPKQTEEELALIQLNAIKEEVEQLCRVPEEDEMYVYELTAEGGSEQHTAAMAQLIIERVAELHQYVDEKALEGDAAEARYLPAFMHDANEATKTANGIPNLRGHHSRLTDVESRLRQFSAEIKGDLEAHATAARNAPDNFELALMERHELDAHSLSPVGRELRLKRRFEELRRIEQKTWGAKEAIADCVATLRSVGGSRRCPKCWLEYRRLVSAEASYTGKSRADFTLFRNFWNEEMEGSYVVRFEALGGLREALVRNVEGMRSYYIGLIREMGHTGWREARLAELEKLKSVLLKL